jgi:hypothetical protein
MADVDATLEQQLFYLAQRQRINDLDHHRLVDDFG